MQCWVKQRTTPCLDHLTKLSPIVKAACKPIKYWSRYLGYKLLWFDILSRFETNPKLRTFAHNQSSNACKCNNHVQMWQTDTMDMVPPSKFQSSAKEQHSLKVERALQSHSLYIKSSKVHMHVYKRCMHLYKWVNFYFISYQLQYIFV